MPNLETLGECQRVSVVAARVFECLALCCAENFYCGNERGIERNLKANLFLSMKKTIFPTYNKPKPYLQIFWC